MREAQLRPSGKKPSPTHGANRGNRLILVSIPSITSVYRNPEIECPTNFFGGRFYGKQSLTAGNAKVNHADLVNL